MDLSHFKHERIFGARFFPGALDSGLPGPNPGLVCERVGSLIRFMLSLCPSPSGTENMAGLDTDDAVGEVGSSSKSVSIVRSSAPVDLATEHNE